jgi:hypothetical protein
MAYISRSCDLTIFGFPKKEILMDYVNRSCDLLEDGISKKGNLMDYVSRSKIPKNSRKIQIK